MRMLSVYSYVRMNINHKWGMKAKEMQSSTTPRRKTLFRKRKAVLVRMKCIHYSRLSYKRQEDSDETESEEEVYFITYN